MLRSFKQRVSFKQQKDSGAETDYSVEFNSGVADPYESSNIIDSSGPLWGPGIRLQQTPALTSQKLDLWRRYSEQPKSINAEAELDKFYASLPEDKLDLTLKDLVDSRKPSPRLTPAKDGDSTTIRALIGSKKSKEVKKGAAREDRGKCKPKNKVHNSPPISFPFKLSAPSSKREKSSPAIPKGSPERQNLSSHFRVEASGLSPRKINAESTASFSVDYEKGLFTIGDEIARSRSPDLQHREQLSQASEESKSTSVRHSVPQSHECSSCSASNLIFKTRCTVCGKTYCSRCVRKEMDNMPDGRICRKTCGGRPSNARFTKKSGVSCWPLFGFSNNYASVAETTAKISGERQDGRRFQEFELRRKSKSSSYPPSSQLHKKHP